MIACAHTLQSKVCCPAVSAGAAVEQNKPQAVPRAVSAPVTASAPVPKAPEAPAPKAPAPRAALFPESVPKPKSRAEIMQAMCARERKPAQAPRAAPAPALAPEPTPVQKPASLLDAEAEVPPTKPATPVAKKKRAPREAPDAVPSATAAQVPSASASLQSQASLSRQNSRRRRQYRTIGKSIDAVWEAKDETGDGGKEKLLAALSDLLESKRTKGKKKAMMQTPPTGAALLARATLPPRRR
eukprot:2939538-Pleurochrysis_carterae.AAC.1